MGRVELEGALSLVTGAGSGIGRATALALAAAGSTVICTDVNLPSAESAAEACKGAGAPAAAAFELDVTDATAMAHVAEQVAGAYGELDILVNNAGVGMSGRLDEMPLEDWAWIRGINLDGVVNGCHLFGGPMVARGRGQVVNISSLLGFTPTPAEVAYGTTKAAVLALSLSLRAGWAPLGVGVTAVCPGLIRTAIIDGSRFFGEGAGDPGARERVAAVFKRGHPPELVARAILDAIREDRAVVTVGAEAKVAWAIHRVAPVRLQQALLRGGAKLRMRRSPGAR